MVKLGFIVEGKTEKIVLENSDLFLHLESLFIQYVPDVIDAKGNGNLLPENLPQFTSILENKGANTIIILTDLDADQCITITKKRIDPLPSQIVVICVKEIEAWFLSDTEAMKQFLNDEKFICEYPEEKEDPFEIIKSLRKEKIGQGFKYKSTLANLMVFKSNFSILNAAKHPNCNSAKYFLKKISELSNL